MLALRAAGFRVEFRPGNQTAIDCLVDGYPHASQDVQLVVPISSRGPPGQRQEEPAIYDRRPHQLALNWLLEGMIVKSAGRYYLIYAFQSVDALLYNGVAQWQPSRARKHDHLASAADLRVLAHWHSVVASYGQTRRMAEQTRLRLARPYRGRPRRARHPRRMARCVKSRNSRISRRHSSMKCR